MILYNTLKALIYFITVVLFILTAACSSQSQSEQGPTSEIKNETIAPVIQRTRAEAIPAGATKITPQTDAIPPKLHSSEFQVPLPLSGGVNTAGGEDSAFVMPDGNTIYFFFTPDTSIPAEKQLLDGATGIYVSRKQGNLWGPAERILLAGKNELALDGCVFVDGNKMWFGSARQGNFRGVDVWYADYREGRWTNWKNAGKKLNSDYQVGEFHITADGNQMYFHSERPGSKGKYDIWVTSKLEGEWQEPENVAAVNTAETDGWPFITRDGKELWFLRQHQGSPAIFRSKMVNNRWGTPELIISQFAAEPSLDNAGNLYFTHHFIKDGKMLEADIYVALRK